MKNKTIIYYSVYKDLFLLITFFFMFIIGIYFLCNLPAYKPLVKLVSGIVLAQGSFAVLFILIRKHILKKPQIILSTEGIYTMVHGFMKWEDMESARIGQSDTTYTDTESNGRPRRYLIMKEITVRIKGANITETRMVAINSLDVDHEELSGLVVEYRKAHEDSLSNLNQYPHIK